LKRLELVACEAVQDELISGLESKIPNIEYTLIPRIEGKGRTSRKEGTQVWPELNFTLVSYMEDSYLDTAKSIIAEVAARYPREGIFAAACDAERIR